MSLNWFLFGEAVFAMKLRLNVNLKVYEIDIAPDMPLLWALGDFVGLTGTKYGCGIGQCGACTVHVDGKAVRSCSVRASSMSEKDITTIEGLSKNGQHPLQRAWIEADVPQCGYCQAGQIMSAAALLKQNAHPDDEDIIAFMSGNLCRCGTYSRIKDAIQKAAAYDNSAKQ